MAKSFYKSEVWKRKREMILKRDQYICRQCKRYGKTIAANTIHHVLPLEKRPDLKLNNNNLISLCNSCHEGMHNKFNNTLTEAGRMWVEKIIQEHPELLTVSGDTT